MTWTENNRESSRRSYRKYHNARLESSRKWRLKNPGYNAKLLARKLGVVRPLNAECKICHLVVSGSNLCLDHDHKTGKFRGWLCRGCNGALGIAEKNLKDFLLYLKKCHEDDD